jgi:hypothetical protein
MRGGNIPVKDLAEHVAKSVGEKLEADTKAPTAA